MRTSWVRFVTGLVLCLLAIGVARAGMDDMRVVTKLIGSAEMRQSLGKGKFGKWEPLKQGDVISNCEVRTRSKSRVWLQLGDAVNNPAHRPDDVIIYSEVLHPNTRIRLNSQYKAYYSKGKVHIFEVISGKADVEKIRGKVPAEVWYKTHH